MSTRAAQSLLGWYATNRRDLPWRGRREPYAIWVAEVMLQQTRVEAARGYFQRWMRRFPTVRSLAKAREQEVLVAWEGLGYYARALKIRRAAQVVMAEHGGKIPRSVPGLLALPGVGPYTAAAVAALAFGQDEVALDGNLRRVISRVIDLDLDPRTPAGEARLLRWARRHLPPGKASEFNQALMDLGAAICLPRGPRCGACPLRSACRARARGRPESRPVRSGRRPVPRQDRHGRGDSTPWARSDRAAAARKPAGRAMGISRGQVRHRRNGSRLPATRVA